MRITLLLLFGICIAPLACRVLYGGSCTRGTLLQGAYNLRFDNKGNRPLRARGCLADLVGNGLDWRRGLPWFDPALWDFLIHISAKASLR